MYLTLKELIERLNRVPKHYNIDSEKEIITDAWIAGANDKKYPEGTVLLECCSCNIKDKATEEDFHVLSLYPEKVNKRLN